MTHDQLVAIITTMLITKAGPGVVEQGMTQTSDGLKGWVQTANTIAHAAAGMSGPRQMG